MKGISRAFTLSCVTIICLAGLGKHVTAMTRERLEFAQASIISNQRMLEVALPESATVRLTAGGSYTGELTAFDAENLTLSANGFSQTVPVAEILQVEFQGNVWIHNPDGQIRSRRIRGISVTLEGVPTNALELTDSSNLAMLDLEAVLSDGEFDQLSSNPNLIHALKQLQFSDSESMAVKIVAVRR